MLGRLLLFDYDESRSKKAANRVLKDFNGSYLQVDGYASYNGIVAQKGVHRVGCMAHNRRKFFDAQKSDPKRAKYALSIFKTI